MQTHFDTEKDRNKKRMQKHCEQDIIKDNMMRGIMITMWKASFNV